MIPRISILVLMALICLAPATAHACGVCVDMFFLEQAWWMPLLPSMTGVLIVEGILMDVGRTARGQPARGGLGALLGLLLAVLLAGLFHVGAILPTAIYGVVLASRFVRSLRTEDLPALWQRLRIGLVLGAACVIAFALLPARKSTEALLEDATFFKSSHWFGPRWVPTPENWAERALVARRDAPSVIGKAYAATASEGTFSSGRIFLARLSLIAGGGDELVRSVCTELRRRRPSEFQFCDPYVPAEPRTASSPATR